MSFFSPKWHNKIGEEKGEQKDLIAFIHDITDQSMSLDDLIGLHAFIYGLDCTFDILKLFV